MSQELAKYLLQKLKKENADDVVISLSSIDNTLIKFYNNKTYLLSFNNCFNY